MKDVNVYVNKKTGEELVTAKGQNFVKMYIKSMIEMLDVVGGKRVEVIKYILKHIRLSDNTLYKTQREIASACNVSTKTVNDTLKRLSDKGILKKKTGAYMLSPNIFYRGDERRKMNMMHQFASFDGKN